MNMACPVPIVFDDTNYRVLLSYCYLLEKGLTLGHDTLITLGAGRDNNVGDIALLGLVLKLHSGLKVA